MNKAKSISRMSILGIFFNLILLILKLLIGIFTMNQTMIADGLNSAGDVLSSVLSFIGNKIASIPNDENHPYGHGKAEYIFSMFIGLTLLYVAFSIFKGGLSSLFEKKTFFYSPYLILVAIITIMVKLGLYLYCDKLYKKFNSLLAHANGIDHRNDVFITSLTLISAVSGYFGYFLVDGIGSMLISIFLAYSAFEILIGSYNVLMDTNIDKNVMSYYAKKIDHIECLDHIDEITARPTGLNYMLIVKVSVDAYMSVYDSHKIAKKIKLILIEESLVDDVIVHINPAQFHEYKLNY